jgi:hypothetical protein
MKHIFIELGLRDGESEFSSKTVLEIEDNKDIDAAADEYLMDFWGPAEAEAGSSWVTFPNQVIGKVRAVREIPAADYEVLARYI